MVKDQILCPKRAISNRKNHYNLPSLWFQEITGAFVEMARAALAVVHRRCSAPARIFLSSDNLIIYIIKTFKYIHIFFNYITSRPVDGT